MELKTINKNGELFISLTDLFSSKFKRKYGRSFNISQSVRNMPDIYIHKTRGRKGATFISANIMHFFLSSKRNIPMEFKRDILQSLSEDNLLLNGSQESFFVDILQSFLKSAFPNMSFLRQFQLKNKLFDACIGNKVLIEFDEEEHLNTKKNDDYKDSLADANSYRIMRVKSKSDYGKSIHEIYRFVIDNTL